MKLLGIAIGDPNDPMTQSGTAKYLLDALARRHTVERLDISLGGWQRALTLAITARWPKDAWQQAYHQNALAYQFRTRNLKQGMASVDHDLVVQVMGWVWPRVYTRPYVVYADTTFDTVREHWPPWYPRSRVALRAEAEMFRRARHVFVNNGQIVDSLLNFYGLPEEQVTVVHAGLNFAPVPPVRRSHAPQILFVGRDFDRKGGQFLLQAFARVRNVLPEATLTIVGPKRPIRQPGVRWLGNLEDRGAMSELYREAALFCLPSLYDPFPNSFAEAMSHGLPCIGTAAGGIPEILGHGRQGLLVEPRDANALAEALLRLLTNPEFADELGRAARERVATYLNWAAVAERMEPGLAAALSGTDGSGDRHSMPGRHSD